MQGLTWAQFETVAYKLTVFAEVGTLENLITAIHIIIEKDVSDMLHMHPYLMGTARLKVTFHKRHITETLKNAVMCYSILADGIIR